MEHIMIQDIERMVESGQLEALQILWEECQDIGEEIQWDTVVQTVYLHAALHKQYPICEWLDTVYQTMDPQLQKALLPIFPYARMLLSRP